MAQLQYQDITDVYSINNSTMEFLVNSGSSVGACKGGVIDWVERFPASKPLDASIILAKVGNYEYVDIGVQDCYSSAPNSGIALQFKQAVAKMVVAN